MRFINFISSKSTSPHITLFKWLFSSCRPFQWRKRASDCYWRIFYFFFVKRILRIYRRIPIFLFKFIQSFFYNIFRFFLTNFFIISFFYNLYYQRRPSITSPNKFNIIITLRICERRRSNSYKLSFRKFNQLFFKNLIR